MSIIVRHCKVFGQVFRLSHWNCGLLHGVYVLEVSDPMTGFPATFRRMALCARPLRFLLVCIMLTFASAYHAVAASSETKTSVTELTPAELQSDFDRMRDMLEEVHPGLYRYSTKASMDHVFQSERARLNHPMTRPEFWTVVSATVSQIRCGHTKVNLDDASRKVMSETRKFPLRVLIENRRIVVLFNDTLDDETIRPGMEITKVNGHTTAEILHRILALVPGDGDIETGKWNEIGNLFSQYYWLAFEPSTEFTIEARNGSGRRVVAHLAGVTDSERRTNHNATNDTIRARLRELRGWSSDNLSMRFLNGGEVAEIHIGHFVGDNFSQWVEATFETLQQKQTKALILDLRGNGGGEDQNVSLFLSFLVNRPFRYLDHVEVKTITPSFQDQLGWSTDFATILKERTVPNPGGGYLLTSRMLPGLADQPPANHAFQGTVFVLIDGGSFSGAADLAALIHHLKRGKFIGEETGGGYYGNSSGKLPTVTLPNSGLKLQLPLYGYWNAVAGDDGQRRGTRPDYVVPTDISAVLKGQDRQLDTALKLAGYESVH